MASSRRKNTQRKVSYAEVDSDVDMQADEKQLNETKARSKRQKKGMGKQKQAAEQAADAEDVTPSLEIFLGMPLDILAEICTHLDPASLIKLSRTSKRFRSLLLARSSRSIWLNARRSANLPELKGLSEINYALLLFGSACTKCGSENKTVEVDYVLRVRHCRPCRKANLTARGLLSQLEPPLHPRAVDCVPEAWAGLDGRKGWRTYYPSRELLDASATLKDLEDDDEVAQDAYANRRRSSGTRSRQPKEEPSRPQSAVKQFANKKASDAAKRMKEGEAVAKAIKLNEALAQELLNEARIAEWTDLQVELEIAEWLEAEIEWYLANVFCAAHWGAGFGSARKYEKLVRPRSSRPGDDPQAWDTIHDQVGAYIEQEEREKAATAVKHALQSRLLAQGQFVRPYHEQMLKAQSKGQATLTFPRLDPFMLLPSVKELWEPRGVTLDDEAWEAALEDIKIDVEEYRATTRVTAIKTILAATTSTPIGSLSDDPADYNEQEYGGAFFARITSQFLKRSNVAKSYPAVLAQLSWGTFVAKDDDEVELGRLLDRRHTHAVRAILSVLDLDEDTATMADFESHTFQWTNHPKEALQERSWTALQLIDEVASRLRLTKKKPLPGLDIRCTPVSKTTDVLHSPRSDDSDSDEEDDSARKRGVAESEDEQGSGPDSTDDDDDARPGKHAKSSRLKKRSAVKLEEDPASEGEDDSEDEGEGEGEGEE